MSFNQGEFDFDSGSDEGFRNWRRRLDEEKLAFENRWGIILGRRVAVELKWLDRPLEGIVRLASETPPKDAKSLRLRLGDLEFTPAEVASMVRVDEPPEP